MADAASLLQALLPPGQSNFGLGANPSAQQLSDLSAYGQSASNAQLPSTLYSPVGGIGYLLDKLNGRSAIENSSSISKDALIKAISDMAMPSAPQMQNQAQPPPDQTQQAPASLTQANTPAVNPIAQAAAISKIGSLLKSSIPPDGAANPSNIDQTAKTVIVQPASGGTQYELDAKQASDLPPGDKIIATRDAEGNEHPISASESPQTAPTAPAAPAASAAPTQPIASPAANQGAITPSSAAQPSSNSNAPFANKFPPPPPPMSKDELQDFQSLSPQQQQQFAQMRTSRYTPQTYETELGTHWVMPNGDNGFISKPKFDTIDLNGLKVPTRTAIDPQTGEAKTQFQLPGVNGQTSWGTLDQLQSHQQDIGAAGKQKDAIATEAAKIWEKPVTDTIEAGNAATTLKTQVGLLQQIQNSTGGLDDISTGKYASQIMDIKKAINNAIPGTFDSDALAKGETITKINTQIARMFARQLTNRPTQFDFKTFISNTPGLENTPQGQKTLASLYMSMAQQDEQLGNLASQYAGKPQEFQQAKTDFYTQHPISIQANGKNFTFAYDKPIMVDGKPVAPGDLSKTLGNTTAAPTKKKWGWDAQGNLVPQ